MSRTKPAAPDLRVKRWTAGAWSESPDAVVMEEPLQLLLDGEPLSVVMRTPGNDIELTLGLLFAEGRTSSTWSSWESPVAGPSGRCSPAPPAAFAAR